MAVKAPKVPGYTPIADRIFIRNEDAPTNPPPAREHHHHHHPGADDDPTLILIYGWGNAHPRHLSKYADGYHALFPAARILIIVSSTLAAAWQPLQQRTDAMMPVVDAVFPSLPAPSGDDRVILHAMSNTGGIFAAATLHAYRQRHGAALPHRLCVSDSTPGSVAVATEAWRWARALARGTAARFPSWPAVSLAATAFWWVFMWAVHVAGRALGVEATGEWSAAAFVDRGMATRRAPRLYMYSKEDDLIGWEDLEEQAAVARSRGYETVMERFEGSPHVGHMRMFPKQYWGAIARCWRESATEKGAAGSDGVEA